MLPNVFPVLWTSRACRGHIRLLCYRWVYTNSVRSLSLTTQLYKKLTRQTFSLLKMLKRGCGDLFSSKILKRSVLKKFLGWYSPGLDITRPVTLFPTRFTCVELRMGSPWSCTLDLPENADALQNKTFLQCPVRSREELASISIQ